MLKPVHQLIRKTLSPTNIKSKSPVFNSANRILKQESTPNRFSKQLDFPNALTNTLRAPELKTLIINSPEQKNILKNGLTAKCYTECVLGYGSFGTVVQAFYKNESIAIKIVRNKPNKRNLLECESNALKLNHSNIVKTLKIVSEPFSSYALILMQNYNDSSDMQQLLENESNDITLPVRVKWAMQICEALQYCHSNQIVHLDLKPRNILVEKETGICRLCDFGCSVDLGQNVHKTFLKQDQVGTVAYTAPELFQGRTVEFSCDIYSLGITLWQMHSRQVPYQHFENNESLIYYVVKWGLRPPSPSNVHSMYSELYKKCWAENSHLRPTLDEIINTLQTIQ